MRSGFAPPLSRHEPHKPLPGGEPLRVPSWSVSPHSRFVRPGFVGGLKDLRLNHWIDRLCGPMPNRAECLENNTHDPGKRTRPKWRSW
jgi:hypothetical protein